MYMKTSRRLRWYKTSVGSRIRFEGDWQTKLSSGCTKAAIMKQFRVKAHPHCLCTEDILAVDVYPALLRKLRIVSNYSTRATSLSDVHFPLSHRGATWNTAQEQQASRALHVTSQRLHTPNSDIALRCRDLLQAAFTITTSHTISWHVTWSAFDRRC